MDFMSYATNLLPNVTALLHDATNLLPNVTPLLHDAMIPEQDVHEPLQGYIHMSLFQNSVQATSSYPRESVLTVTA